MKMLSLFVVPFVLLSAAAQAETFICSEITKDLPPGRGRISVIVQETADITKKFPNTKYDYIYEVDVTIQKTAPRRRNQIIKQFQARAYSEDVNYRMVSLKDRTTFYVYLDEMNEAAVEFQNENGSITKVRLSCEYAM